MAHFVPFSPFFALFAQKRRNGKKPRLFPAGIFGLTKTRNLGSRERSVSADTATGLLSSIFGFFESSQVFLRPQDPKNGQIWSNWTDSGGPGRPDRSDPAQIGQVLEGPQGAQKTLYRPLFNSEVSTYPPPNWGVLHQKSAEFSHKRFRAGPARAHFRARQNLAIFRHFLPFLGKNG